MRPLYLVSIVLPYRWTKNKTSKTNDQMCTHSKLEQFSRMYERVPFNGNLNGILFLWNENVREVAIDSQIFVEDGSVNCFILDRSKWASVRTFVENKTSIEQKVTFMFTWHSTSFGSHPCIFASSIKE